MLQLSDVLVFVLCFVASALALATLHWMPFAGTEELRDRRLCYALGTCVTVGVPALALLLTDALGQHHDERFWAALLLSNMVICGLTVQVCYWIDDRHQQPRPPITLEDIEDAEKSRDHGGVWGDDGG